MGTDAEAGRRLRQTIDAAIGRSSTIHSISDLCRQARVNRNTVYAWFTGTTIPSANSLSRVAHVLDMSVVDLLVSYEGRYPEPTEELVRDLIDRLDGIAHRLDGVTLRMDALASGAVIAEVIRALERKPLGVVAEW